MSMATSGPGAAPPASPGVTDVDRLHSQMLALQDQVRDYELDMAALQRIPTVPVRAPAPIKPIPQRLNSNGSTGGPPGGAPSPRGAVPSPMSPLRKLAASPASSLGSSSAPAPSAPLPSTPTRAAPKPARPLPARVDTSRAAAADMSKPFDLASLADELPDDDIDALYHSIRQQKIASVLIEPHAMPQSPLYSESAALRRDNVTLRESLAEYKRKVADLAKANDETVKKMRATDEQMRHLQMLFDQAHADNAAKYDRIADLEADVDELRADVREREVVNDRLHEQLTQAQDQLFEQESLVAKLHRDLDRFADTEQQLRKMAAHAEQLAAENEKLRAQLLEVQQDQRQTQFQENMARRGSALPIPVSPVAGPTATAAAGSASPDPAGSGIETDAPPPPSQIKALDRAFADQLELERAEFAKQLKEVERQAREAELARRRAEAELEGLRDRAEEQAAEAKKLKRRSDFRSRPMSWQVEAAPATNQDLEMELEAYKVHVHHLKSILQSNPSSREYEEKVSSLSLKLSYWTVLRDVYEDTIQELMAMANIDVDSASES
ncbi:hypothetical protein AMAG_04692 [Allomyces macrogynus ATCC 38327]|uniref:Uncharacterized protein n=1 Tax=Allomyces macrogynus (strain ATCC 38327) TaxID=578462 RepID=A0A0L0S5R6_ALLM3|nr:hypothetical protein AMAG_04692 [Allomyces macrogynus ATCC 38327]|eukprot:KNE57847.1 hypothetical protein AMAG_04692 [Allomyces macrogynus ATCC 38327]